MVIWRLTALHMLQDPHLSIQALIGWTTGSMAQAYYALVGSTSFGSHTSNSIF